MFGGVGNSINTVLTKITKNNKKFNFFKPDLLGKKNGELKQNGFHRTATINHSTAKLFNLNFHPLEVSYPQLQVSENCSDLTKWSSTLFKSCWLISHFIFNIFKMWYLLC